MLSFVWLFVAPWTITRQAPVHGISQARILEWVAISFSRGSFNARTGFAFPGTPALAGGFLTTAPPGTMAYRALRIWHLPTLAISGPTNPLPTHYFSATRASLLFLKHINHTTTLGALCLLGIPSLRSSHAHSLPLFKSSMVAKEIPWTIIYKIGPPIASITKTGFVVLYYLITWNKYLFYHPTSFGSQFLLKCYLEKNRESYLII